MKKILNSLIKLSKLPIVQQVSELKKQKDAFQPLSTEQEGRIMQKFRLDWNYHSNAIEGNSLNYGETQAFLMYGITAKGKPFKDYLDIKGHNIAIDFVQSLLKNDSELTEKDIRDLHSLLLVEPYEKDVETPFGIQKRLIQIGQYKTMPNHVKTPTGEIHYYASVEETPMKMQELMSFYRETQHNSAIHAVVLAAYFHHEFVSIHPFDDGNGRMTRLLMNLILMQNHYLPAIIKGDKDSRNLYYFALSQADAGNLEPFVELIAEAELHSLEIYIKGAKGENIDEPSDLDKELALFKKELEGDEKNIKITVNNEVKKSIFENSFLPLYKSIQVVNSKFIDLFFNYKEYDASNESIKLQLVKNILVDVVYKPPVISGEYNDLIHNFYKNLPVNDKVFIGFKFDGFKQKDNLFGVEYGIKMVFEEYNYSFILIYWQSEIIGIPQKKLTKLYHQQLTQQEIEEITTDIGKMILKHIKEKTKSDEK